MRADQLIDLGVATVETKGSPIVSFELDSPHTGWRPDAVGLDMLDLGTATVETKGSPIVTDELDSPALGYRQMAVGLTED